jgi:hypothetical protein
LASTISFVFESIVECGVNEYRADACYCSGSLVIYESSCVVLCPSGYSSVSGVCLAATIGTIDPGYGGGNVATSDDTPILYRTIMTLTIGYGVSNQRITWQQVHTAIRQQISQQLLGMTGTSRLTLVNPMYSSSSIAENLNSANVTIDFYGASSTNITAGMSSSSRCAAAAAAAEMIE